MVDEAEKPKGFARQIADLREILTVAQRERSDALAALSAERARVKMAEDARVAAVARADTLELRLQRTLGYLERITEAEPELADQVEAYRAPPIIRRRGPDLESVHPIRGAPGKPF